MSKLYQFIILLLDFSTPVHVFDQSGIVSGKVTSNENVSLPGATIKLSSINRYTVSTQTGTFEFLNVPAGNYEISVNYLGYQSVRQPITVKAGENKSIDLVLESGSTQMDAVVVMGDLLR